MGCASILLALLLTGDAAARGSQVQLAKAAHVCALSKAGELSCWGYNAYGGAGPAAKGEGPLRTRPVPIDLGPPP